MAENSLNQAAKKIDLIDRSSVEKQKEQESKEIESKLKPIETGAIDVVAGAEIAESIEGRVAEKMGEGKKKAPSGSYAGTGDDSSATAAITDASYPRVEVMRIQVSTKIKKEISALKKEAKKLKRSPIKFMPFQLNRVISRIRKLRELLASLVHATEETVKNLWQKFVKGGAS